MDLLCVQFHHRFIWLWVLLGITVMQVGTSDAVGQVVISGSVRDSVTLLPLTSAHVILTGSDQGTITNREGTFEITITRLPATLLFRHVGYHSLEVEFVPNGARTINVNLIPVPIQLPELLIAGDYLATSIMEEVIRRKAERRTHLNAYQSRGYARITLMNRDQIVLINEAVFDRFYSKDSGIRNVIRSKRETSDFHEQLGLKIVPQDFSSDAVEINGLSFFGPTHPDALEHYTFTFAGRRIWNQLPLYDIYVAPKTNQEATFVGRIAVMDSIFALVEIDLKPASHVTFSPETHDWSISYRQQFAKVDSFWLPVDIDLQGWIHVEPNGQRIRPAVVAQTGRMVDYQVNQTVPTAPFASEDQIQIDSISVIRDDLFLMGLDMIALTPRELEALEDLRWKKPLTLREALPAEKAVTGGAILNEIYSFELGDPSQFSWPAITGLVPWVRYNRVDGTHIGAGTAFPYGRNNIISARIAQSLKIGRTRASASLKTKRGRSWQTILSFERNSQPQNGTLIHTEAMNSILSRIFAIDVYDWYWATKVHAGAQYQTNWGRMTLTGTYTWMDSMQTSVTSPWPLTKTFSYNPSIITGQRQSIEFTFATGSSWQPYFIHPSKRLEVKIGFANSPHQQRDLRLSLAGDYWVRTLMRRRPKPSTLSVRFLAGFVTNQAPKDRWHVVDGTMGPIGELGTLRSVRNHRWTGRRIAGAYWEHDFRSLLFELLQLRPLVDQNVSVRLGGGHVYIDGRWIHEGTFSIARAPVRIHLTRRMDHPSIFFGIGYVGRH